MNLPEAYQKKIQSLLGDDYDNYEDSFAHHCGQTLRVNQLKMMPAEFFRRFPLCHNDKKLRQQDMENDSKAYIKWKNVPWCENGFYYEGEDRLSLHPYYFAGAYYIQEPSAMAPASFLPVVPGDRVLDLCAAPGGKTTALAAKLQGKGVLVANDISISRCKALLKNVEMAGVRNCMITCETPEKLADHFGSYFDKILVDAPCSGEGMFRRDPSMIKNWSPEEVERYSTIQKEILYTAASMLKPGGYLLYSTCTYSPEENEQVVESLLNSDSSFSLVELPLYEGVDQGHPEWTIDQREEIRYCRRFWNHRVEGEGQFTALLKKAESDAGGTDREQSNTINHSNEGFDLAKLEVNHSVNEENDYMKKAKKKKSRKGKKGMGKGNQMEALSGNIPDELFSFFKRFSFAVPKERIELIEERAFLLPEDLPDFTGIRVVRSGLYLGDCKKKRFEPSQALAMALIPEEYSNTLSLSLDDDRIEKYLRCETINGQADDGWVLVCVDDLPLGWGKCSRGTIKNKYAAGWRKV